MIVVKDYSALVVAASVIAALVAGVATAAGDSYVVLAYVFTPGWTGRTLLELVVPG